LNSFTLSLDEINILKKSLQELTSSASALYLNAYIFKLINKFFLDTMNIWQGFVLIFLIIAMFVQDIAAKVTKKAEPAKKPAPAPKKVEKKSEKTSKKKVVE
jgi:Na+-transporting methylmalonyl-CoA/oxaloacetate decarboxylase gamma subunit